MTKKNFRANFSNFPSASRARPVPYLRKKVNLVGTERKSQGTFVPMRPTYGPNFSFLRPLGGPQIDETVGKTLFLRGRLRAEDGRIRPRPFYAKSLILTQILKVLLWPDLCDVILGVRSAVEERSFFARKWIFFFFFFCGAHLPSDPTLGSGFSLVRANWPDFGLIFHNFSH